jgi:hypothetical protein
MLSIGDGSVLVKMHATAYNIGLVYFGCQGATACCWGT